MAVRQYFGGERPHELRTGVLFKPVHRRIAVR
jgi:hypothetical protein